MINQSPLAEEIDVFEMGTIEATLTVSDERTKRYQLPRATARTTLAKTPEPSLFLAKLDTITKHGGVDLLISSKRGASRTVSRVLHPGTPPAD